ncbi:MAG TPA: hypothetical protein VN864_02200, partial [Thermoplasmata archaeon]|nr:hypothetical protein [Thermoplasmata archaeon]
VSYSSAFNESVTFVVSPSGAGSIEFDFRNVTTNVSVNSSVVNTTYQLKAYAAYGYRFLGWNVTGPAQTPSGELVVNGTGAVVTARFGIKFFPVTFVAIRPVSITIKLNGVSVPSGTTLTLARGPYNVSASVTASNTTFLGWSSGLPLGNISTDHTSATVTVTGPGAVYGLVAAFVLQGLTIGPSTIDVGAPSHLTVFASGSGPLTYKYLGLPPGCGSADRATLTCRPTAAGTYPVRASVSDSSGALATTSSELLTVVGDPLVATFTVSPSATDVALLVTISATVQQGLAPYTYTYSGLPPGCTPANAPRVACHPSGTGAFNVRLSVNDSDGLVATANASLIIHPDPSILGLSFTHPVDDVGIPTLLSVTATGGTGPLSYAYAGLPAGCSATVSPTLACTPTTAGTSNVTVTVTDQFGQGAQASARLTVHARPTVTAFTIAPAAIVLGQAVQLTVVASGGTGSIGYTYTGLPTGCQSTNTSTFTCAPSAAGSFTITVAAFDPFGANGTGSAKLTVSSPSPGPGPSGSPTTGIDWWIVGAVALIAAIVAGVFVLWFGRPPKPRGPVDPEAGTAIPPR